MNSVFPPVPVYIGEDNPGPMMPHTVWIKPSTGEIFSVDPAGNFILQGTITPTSTTTTSTSTSTTTTTTTETTTTTTTTSTSTSTSTSTTTTTTGG